MKWLLKWLVRCLALLLVLVVILLLSFNPVLKAVIEHRIRAQTGLDAEIGSLSVGVFSPTMTVRDFKLYNPSNFGGTLFLSIPEIHAEYDRNLLSQHEIHVTLLRINLGEVNIVRDETGRTNLIALGVSLPSKSGSLNQAEFHRRTGFKFTGIDVLNVSVGTARFVDLKNPQANREQRIGIDNCIVKNVKSPADLAGLEVLIALRGGDFFNSLAGLKIPGAKFP